MDVRFDTLRNPSRQAPARSPTSGVAGNRAGGTRRRVRARRTRPGAPRVLTRRGAGRHRWRKRARVVRQRRALRDAAVCSCRDDSARAALYGADTTNACHVSTEDGCERRHTHRRPDSGGSPHAARRQRATRRDVRPPDSGATVARTSSLHGTALQHRLHRVSSCSTVFYSTRWQRSNEQ